VPFQKNDIVFHAALCQENTALSSNKIQYYLIVVALDSDEKERIIYKKKIDLLWTVYHEKVDA
jgi:hypothetical protein